MSRKSGHTISQNLEPPDQDVKQHVRAMLRKLTALKRMTGESGASSMKSSS